MNWFLMRASNETLSSRVTRYRRSNEAVFSGKTSAKEERAGSQYASPARQAGWERGNELSKNSSASPGPTSMCPDLLRPTVLVVLLHTEGGGRPKRARGRRYGARHRFMFGVELRCAASAGGRRMTSAGGTGRQEPAAAPGHGASLGRLSCRKQINRGGNRPIAENWGGHKYWAVGPENSRGGCPRPGVREKRAGHVIPCSYNAIVSLSYTHAAVLSPAVNCYLQLLFVCLFAPRSNAYTRTDPSSLDTAISRRSPSARAGRHAICVTALSGVILQCISRAGHTGK